MSNDPPFANGAPPAPVHFETTQWSLVVAAKDRASPEARQALAALCEAYWYPLYAFIRRQGHSSEEAQDLTQEFFARLLEKDFLAMVDRQKGKFRSFLLACCKHFLVNEGERARATKRGGGRSIFSIDRNDAELRWSRELAGRAPADRLFERRWALALLDQVLFQLREECVKRDQGEHFERLKIFLTRDRAGISYAQAAGELQLSEGGVRVAVHRLRRRYRELLRQEIARTVHEAADVEAEIRDLFNALGS
jgi:RNA polymerase sigma-70 factor (ECF subfamily)